MYSKLMDYRASQAQKDTKEIKRNASYFFFFLSSTSKEQFDGMKEKRKLGKFFLVHLFLYLLSDIVNW